MKFAGIRQDVAGVNGDPGHAEDAENVGLAVEGELRRRPGLLKQQGVFTRVGGPNRAISIPAFDETTIVWWWDPSDVGDFEPPVLVWPLEDIFPEEAVDPVPQSPWNYPWNGKSLPISRAGRRRVRVPPGELFTVSVDLPIVVHNGNKTATITITDKDGNVAVDAIGAVLLIRWTVLPDQDVVREDVVRLAGGGVGVSWAFPNAFTALDDGKTLKVEAAVLDPVAKNLLSALGSDTAEIVYEAVAQTPFWIAVTTLPTAVEDSLGANDWTGGVNLVVSDSYWRPQAAGLPAPDALSVPAVYAPLDMDTLYYAGIQFMVSIGTWSNASATQILMYSGAGATLLTLRHGTTAEGYADHLILVDPTGAVVWEQSIAEGDLLTFTLLARRAGDGTFVRRTLYLGADQEYERTDIGFTGLLVSQISTYRTGLGPTYTGIKDIKSY